MPVQTLDPLAPITGHVWLYEGRRRKTWYAKWRDQQGQHQKALGPDWAGKGKPPEGFYNEREAKESSMKSSLTRAVGSGDRSASA